MENNKRRTLGPMNSNQLNSRASLAPSRITKDGLAGKKLSMLGGRPSIAGGRGLPGGGAVKSSMANAARRYMTALGNAACVSRMKLDSAISFGLT